ncbi:MAG: YihA family ribosome biogenesis GTP-binding protein [Desulfovibrionaceae bacterium]|jgi:GTP-binding protein|nr:YihA family ribosome biogenesis GTP-binding protein [Desulfovibrionaceae bacterium]
MPRLVLEHTVYTAKQLDAVPLQWPDAPLIAMAGRSNVGKSSLINRLAGRKTLAKTSSTPGKTRSINYYRVEPLGAEGAVPRLYVVDLPGYGYAKCSKAERDAWARLIERFLSSSKAPAAVAVLLDSRIAPQNNDLDMIEYVRGQGLPLMAVLTKTDKCKQREQAARRKEWKALLGGRVDPLLFSARTGQGAANLWRALIERAAPGAAEVPAELVLPEAALPAESPAPAVSEKDPDA